MGKFSTILLILTVFFGISCSERDALPYEDDLVSLDGLLDDMDHYVSLKQQRISTIENLLNSRGVTPQQQYQIYGQLYDEYEAFQFDKALEMLGHQERIAASLGKDDLAADVRLEKAHLFTVAGMFLEAEHVFNGLDTTSFSTSQMIAWYDARQKFLHDYQEYMNTSGIAVPEADKIPYYQEQILLNTSESSSLNRHMRILRLINARRWEEASSANMEIIKSLDRDSRDYAVQTYWQGFICENQDDMDQAMKWWIESAMCDVRGAIKDNASLCTIAVNLSTPEDTDRAFRYIRLSLDDALFYNAKLRKVQIASTLPWIEKAYMDSKERQSRERNRYLLMTTVIALFLFAACAFTVRMYFRGRRSTALVKQKNMQLAEYARSIEETKKNLKRANMELIEANAAKEEYLGLFLSRCSDYLDMLKKVMSREQYEAELRAFYKSFDTSFLTLYPRFVDEFNDLLADDSRITVKKGELLTTELRIYALIKLGISQSSHIASLLRYSVNTIYNYRAHIRNAAKGDKETFEDRVRMIGFRH